MSPAPSPPGAPGGPPVLSVAELNRRIRARLESDRALADLWVEGEVSNCFRASSGHLYFTLKQDGAEVRCVMWRTFALSCPDLADGHGIMVRADVTVYEQRGQYQLQVRHVQPAGQGLLWMKLDALKKTLEAEGLFDPAKKRPIPRIPRRIGVVTSRDGAALQDILNVLGRRAPYVEVVVADARVQGAGAAASLVRALRRVVLEDVDVVILGRGGGSLEDLWAFNEEVLVRAVAAAPVPVISAVGHETDTALSDLAADLRAATPSAAAEAVALSIWEMHQHLDGAERRMAKRLEGRLEVARHRLDALAARPLFRRPEALLAPLRARVEGSAARLPRALGARLERARGRLVDVERRAPRALAARLEAMRRETGRMAALLDALSPLKVLGRGFTLATHDGRLVRRAATLRPGDPLTLRFSDGRVTARTESVDIDEEGDP